MELPAAFCRRMERLLGADCKRFFESYATPLRRGVRVNLLKTDKERFLSLFPLPLVPSPFATDGFYLDAPHKAGGDPLFHAGAYYMQEPSASAAVTVLSPQAGERILDLCAAPGGKSTQIAAALGGTGLLWSNEYVRARAHILGQNAERCGVRNAVLSSSDAETLARGLPAFFDAVLVDAPCSGEGMFRKEPAALSEWSEDNVAHCAARQRDILDAAAKTVKAGGRLVYSTCTFAPEENECTAAWFLETHPDFEPLPIAVSFGEAGFAFDRVAAFDKTVRGARYDAAACRRILPWHGGEGHFIAAFRRTDAPPTVPAPFVYPKDKNADAAAALFCDCFAGEMYGVPLTVGDTVRLLPAGLPAFSGLPVLSAGVALAAVCKNRLEPCHAVFAAARAAECRRLLSLPPADARLAAFLHGEELQTDGAAGFTAVAVAGISVGFGKCAGGRLKNRYPKGLRNF